MDKKENTSQNGIESEYIDIIDMLGMLWKARFYILTGASICLMVSGAVCVTLHPVTYKTTLPLFTESTGAPSLSSAIATFNAAVSQPSISGRIYDLMEKNADVPLREALTSAGISREMFISSQAGNEGPELFRLARAKSGENLASELKIKHRDIGALISLALVRASREIIVAHNNLAIVNRSQIVAEQVKKSLEVTTPYQQIIKARLAEESIPRAALFELEAALAGKLSGQSDSIARTGDSDHIMRILGALIHSKKISNIEAANFQMQRDALVASIETVKTKYEQALKVGEVLLATLSDDILRRAMDSADQLPVFTVATEVQNGEISLASIEKSDSKLAQYLFLGFAVGGLIGFVAYYLRTYVQANLDRIRVIFGKAV